MLSVAEQKELKANNRICFFDLETTGLDVVKDQIIQIAWIIHDLDTNKVVSVGMKFVFVPPPLSQEIIDLTNIDDMHLAACGEPLLEVLSKFKDEVFKYEVRYLCAHNGYGFDFPLLSNQLSKVGLLSLELQLIDTKVDIEYPKHIKTRGLRHLASEHNFVPLESHDALQDCYTLKKIFMQYDWRNTIAYAAIKNITIYINTSYDQRETAKALGYYWDGATKRWLKDIKENKLDEEVEKAKGFKVVKV